MYLLMENLFQFKRNRFQLKHKNLALSIIFHLVSLRLKCKRTYSQSISFLLKYLWQFFRSQEVSWQNKSFSAHWKNFAPLGKCFRTSENFLAAKNFLKWTLVFKEIIRKNVTFGNTGCGVLIDLQRVFGNFLPTRESYVVHVITNLCCRPYLSNRKQFILVNHFNSNPIIFGLRLWLASLLNHVTTFSDPRHAIRYFRVYNYEGDTNLIHFDKSVSKLNKLVNLD